MKEDKCKNCGHIEANHMNYENDCSTLCKLPLCNCKEFVSDAISEQGDKK